jgi:hypothetical protein
LAYSHVFGHILLIFKNFGHIFKTFWAYLQFLGKFLKFFGLLFKVIETFGHFQKLKIFKIFLHFPKILGTISNIKIFGHIFKIVWAYFPI